MLAIRSTPRAAAIAAAVAGACLMLGGCGGGSIGSAAGSSATASATAAGSAASSAPAVPGLAVPKLTGHFCTDFTNIGKNLPRIPSADKNNLAALQANGGQFFKEAAAYFNGLAGEAPPQAAGELKIIASAYDSLAGGSISAGSVAQLEKQMEGITTHGKAGQAFISLITYITTHCH